MKWSAATIATGHAIHQRYDDERFVREFFLVPQNIVADSERGIGPFEFSRDIQRITSEGVYSEGFYLPPEFTGNVVELPEYMRTAF